MKFCSKCGKEIMDEAVVCPHCGCSVKSESQITKEDDAPSILFALLGFFIPLVGLILWLCFKDSSPRKARSAGKGAIIGVCVSVALAIITSIFSAILIGSIFSGIASLY